VAGADRSHVYWVRHVNCRISQCIGTALRVSVCRPHCCCSVWQQVRVTALIKSPLNKHFLPFNKLRNNFFVSLKWQSRWWLYHTKRFFEAELWVTFESEATCDGLCALCMRTTCRATERRYSTVRHVVMRAYCLTLTWSMATESLATNDACPHTLIVLTRSSLHALVCCLVTKSLLYEDSELAKQSVTESLAVNIFSLKNGLHVDIYIINIV